MYINKLASAIYNDVAGGLSGYQDVSNMSISQLEDDVVDERLQVIYEYNLKNKLPTDDLMITIGSLSVDYRPMDKTVDKINKTQNQPHFECPQIVLGNGIDSISYIGTVDRGVNFVLYTTTSFQYHKYQRRGSDRPYVFIDPTPNYNNMYDGWIFGIPFIKQISITAIFKDPRQVAEIDPNLPDDFDNFNCISDEVKKRLIQKKISYYKQLATRHEE